METGQETLFSSGLDSSSGQMMLTNSDQVARSSRSIDVYAAQCEKCLKWRVIATEEEYEEIRSKLPEIPFLCEKICEISCEDPSNLEYDATRTWVIDKHGLPKTPPGFKRSLILRKDYSKMDVYYVTTTGKKLRSVNDVAAFMVRNPSFTDANLSDFSFATPKVMEATIPPSAREATNSGSSKKKKAKFSAS